MQGAQTDRAIFCYTFSVLAQGPRQGSGFAVNVYDSDTLMYTEFAPGGRAAREQRFVLAPGTRLRLLELIDCASSWLQAVPPRMGTGAVPTTESRLGFSGHGILIAQDLPLLIIRPFRSQVGHNARILYNLLEDVASILYEVGFALQPDSFTWSEQIKPLSTGGTRKHHRLALG